MVGRLDFLQKMEEDKVAAGKFLDTVLLPFYKQHKYGFLLGDLIDPLISEYNQREGTSFDLSGLWFAAQDRITSSEKGELIYHPNFEINDYESIKNCANELKNEHARAERGVEYSFYSSDLGRAQSLAAEAREIRKKTREIQGRGKKELSVRGERANEWLEKNKLSVKGILDSARNGSLSGGK